MKKKCYCKKDKTCGYCDVRAFLYFLDPHTLYHRHEEKKQRKPQNRYRVYGIDNDDYAFGGPLFPNVFIKEVAAKDPIAAVRKVYNHSKKKHLGWRLYDLYARKARVKK